jgi:hypothetical protein
LPKLKKPKKSSEPPPPDFSAMDDLEFSAYLITKLLKSVSPLISEEHVYPIVLDMLVDPEAVDLVEAYGMEIRATVHEEHDPKMH